MISFDSVLKMLQLPFSVSYFGVAVIEFNQWNATVLMFSPENLNAV
jgi:hypothetical protein